MVHSISAGLLVLAVVTAPNANRADCGNLNDRYAAAVKKLTERLREYETCVAASAKAKDCEAEMQAVDTAHDDWVDIVDEAKDCR